MMSAQPNVKEIFSLIRKWAEDNQLEMPSDTSQTFADAGFDSLHSTELAFFLEGELGVEITDTIVWETSTFDALAQYVAERCGAVKPEAAQSSSDDNRPIREGADW
jgi:acyl carrier protein